MATSTAEVLDLLELAEKHRTVLMVDHTFLYTGAVRRLKALIDSGGVGDLLYIDSVRISLGLVQSDINVLWDLGPHDLSIMNYLCDREPVSVSAIGTRHLGCPFENMAYVSIHFRDNFIAHFHVNWLAPVKVRRTLIGGSKKMIVYDDLEPSEKVKVHDKGLRLRGGGGARFKMLVASRSGDRWAPHVEVTEALQTEATHFIESINTQQRSMTDGEAG